MTLPATIIEQAIEALQYMRTEGFVASAAVVRGNTDAQVQVNRALDKCDDAMAGLRTLLTTLPGEGIEEMLKRVPIGYSLYLSHAIKDEKWHCNFVSMFDGMDDAPVSGVADTPSLAIRAALEKIGESDAR